jgi:hypothetical protein
MSRRKRCNLNLLQTGALILATLWCSGSARAADHFYALSDLTYDRSSKPVLINARVVDPKDFPAIFYSLANGHGCTSTLIGTRILLTAAHCVKDGGSIKIHKGVDNYEGTCTVAKAYATNHSADWALCVMAAEPPGMIHETLNTNSGALQLHMDILLSGFGCAEPDNPTSASAATYRIGPATISVLPTGNSNSLEMTGGAALCFGDSGGPAFIVRSEALTQDSSVSASGRLVVAANSRGNLIDSSVIASISTSQAQEFIRDWRDPAPADGNPRPGRGLKICGLDVDAESCRKPP